jgi:hypothetical protein
MERQNKGVAWYDIPGSGWLRDIWILSHPWYTMWHLSYVAIGAALAPVINWALLGWTVLAFFLGMGIAGHCLDELKGRPLKTTLPVPLLWFLAGLGLGGAVSIGLIVADRQTLWLIPCIIFGGFIAVAYNFELGKGFFHLDIWFGVGWGAFPLLTAYVAQTGTLTWPVALLAVWSVLYSLAQRSLSMQSRFWRRKVFGFQGGYALNGAPVTAPLERFSKQLITSPVDLGLKYMNGAIVTMAVGLLIMHLV